MSAAGHGFAQADFDEWPAAKTTAYCGAMAMLNRYLDRNKQGELPDFSGEQRFWWKRVNELYTDPDELKRQLNAANEIFKAELRRSGVEPQYSAAYVRIAQREDTRCVKHRTLVILTERMIGTEEEQKEREQRYADQRRERELQARRAQEEKLTELAQRAPVTVDAAYVDLGHNATAPTLEIYFSLGCNHCLAFFEKYLPRLEQRIAAGTLNLRLLEVPALTPGWWGNRDAERSNAVAKQRALLASRYGHCAAAESGTRYLAFLHQFISALQANILRVDDESWEYYVLAKASEFSSTSAYRSVEQLIQGVGTSLGVSAVACNDDFMRARAQQSYAAMRAIKGEVVVPFFRYEEQPYLVHRESELMQKVLSEQ
ncbi:MAG: thioredoxin domain-containing protein [Pseudomonadales bacterium]